MIEAGPSGSVVHNTSIHGHRSVPHFSAYAASKAGLEALMQGQALVPCPPSRWGATATPATSPA